MSEQVIRSIFIIPEPSRELTKRRLRRTTLFVLVLFAGIGSISYFNYHNQVTVQQIDIAQRSISSMKRLQMSKQARLNELMKFDAIAHKAQALGFVGSTQVTQALPVPTDQFDKRHLALYQKRRHNESNQSPNSFTQQFSKSTRPTSN